MTEVAAPLLGRRSSNDLTLQLLVLKGSRGEMVRSSRGTSPCGCARCGRVRDGSSTARLWGRCSVAMPELVVQPNIIELALEDATWHCGARHSFEAVQGYLLASVIEVG